MASSLSKTRRVRAMPSTLKPLSSSRTAATRGELLALAFLFPVLPLFFVLCPSCLTFCCRVSCCREISGSRKTFLPYLKEEESGDGVSVEDQCRSIKMPGVNTPHIMIGVAGSMTGFHVEDYNFNSFAVHGGGAPALQKTVSQGVRLMPSSTCQHAVTELQLNCSTPRLEPNPFPMLRTVMSKSSRVVVVAAGIEYLCGILCFPTEALDLIKQLTVEFALEDVTSFASASHITSNHFKQHVIPTIPPHERTALTSHERLPSWSEQNSI
uniref:JmjC domain-containing protein n=1 Tax=Daphnia galeata TaxID=27404 RepID=A0A8J2WIM6_9CRUS|nr:unnamed protein product [Daphnia galeata]